MTYASYLKSVGAKKGEYNPFVMTKGEFENFQAGKKSVEQRHAELEQRLVDCQNAWYNAMQQGLTEDAAHAKINEQNAFRALIEFEEKNGL